jgi:hypothetical protein
MRIASKLPKDFPEDREDPSRLNPPGRRDRTECVLPRGERKNNVVSQTMLKERKDALRSEYEDKTPTTMTVMRIIIDPQSRISFRQYLRLVS